MLDIRFIRENKSFVEKANAAKNFRVDIGKLLELDGQINSLQREVEQSQTLRNQLSKDIAKASPETKEDLRQKVLQAKEEIESRQERIRDYKTQWKELMLLVAQPAAADVPEGKDDQGNVELFRWRTPRQFNFPALDHITLGKNLDIFDFERGVKIAGSRSYVLKKDGALLEAAILRFTYDELLKKGWTPVSVPVIVTEAMMEGTGYFPVGRDQAYFMEKDKMALVGTAEVPLCGLHVDEVLEEKNLPLRYMAQSTCFRREAGTYGKDTRGLYRVHQFQKIEMVVIAPADRKLSETLHAELLGNAEHILQSLELPYRRVYVCTGDLGQGQVRKHDLETWMPSRNGYGETHSCSTFYDFQARRLNIKYRNETNDRQFAYTLNNTACAAPRLLLAIVENYQTADGRIEIPKVLRPYMGGREFIS